MGLRNLLAVVAALTGMFAAIPPPSLANDAGVSTANFAESRGCEPFIAGPSRPKVSSTGYMSTNEQMRGPWGDMFGRTYYQVSQSLVDWKLPGSNKTLRVHERMLPALNQAADNLNANFASGKSYYVYSAFAWVWRTVGGTLRPSEHAFGTAFDINPSSNPYGRDNVLRTNMPDWYVESFTDAGFCWGGNWVDVKDPMHFSWSGPGATPNYQGRPAPYPPVTGATGYRGTVVSFVSGIGTRSGTTFTTGDVTGDGAPDIVQLSPSGRIEAAGAVGGYDRIALRDSSGTGSSESLLGDYDLDGRADVWVPDRSGSSIAFDVWTHRSGFQQSVRVTTGVPSTSTNLMLGMYDDDYLPDVYAYDGFGFSVYGSDGGYDSVSVQLAMPDGASATWRFATADHDVDGKSDVYAVSIGASPTLAIRLATGSSVSFSPNLAVAADSAVDFADYDGDGRDDMFVLTGTSLAITLGGGSGGAPDGWFQNASTVPADAGPECLGEACDTIGYVDSGGVWSIADRPRTDPQFNEFYYGNPGDIPFAGDWDCDGVDTPGLYRQSDGFVYLRNANTQGIADLEFYFGNPGDIPLAGDFNGDGCDTVSLFRTSQQRIYVINDLGEDGAGLGVADFFFTFGNVGDVPFAGDFDGDSVDEVGMFRWSTGQMFLKWELAGGAADSTFAYGSPGDIPFAGDWNGDGTDTVAVFRPSRGTWYIRLVNAAGDADHQIRVHAHGTSTPPFVGKMGS
ncbi:MAG: M15 family metallopeptidase [Acidimicrobiia bacterium]